MPGPIQDGTGSSRLAEVDVNNRLSTTSVTSSEELDVNSAGNAYNLNTGIVNLTNDTETPLLYIKNNENKNLVITAIVIGMFNSANGSDTANVTATFIRNPTTGTINESSPTNIPINSNRNYGSKNTLTADAYLGGTGETMTNGDDHILVRISENSRTFVPINEILPKGTSIGIKIQPPTGNDGMNVYVAVICYLQD